MTTAAVEEQPAATDAGETPPIHLARCAECASGVQFSTLPSGHGFVTHGTDQTFGVGEHGRPLCPNGHGEMAIADDSLKPAAEAFADAAEQLAAADGRTDPVQRSLPGVIPAFNFQGCYLELEGQALLVESRRKTYEDDARVAKESKKAWDDAEEKFTKMALEFRRRRQAKDPSDEGPSFAKATPARVCTYDAQRSESDDPCPICDDAVARDVLVSVFGNPDTLAPADAQAHVDEVKTLLAWVDVDLVRQALESVDTYVDHATIAAWSTGERQAVSAWADAAFDRANGKDVELPIRPTVLGKPHIPEKAQLDEPQRCSICDVVLAPATAEGDKYQETDYVGTDCPGKAVAHHYPETGKKKATKKPPTKAKK